MVLFCKFVEGILKSPRKEKPVRAARLAGKGDKDREPGRVIGESRGGKINISLTRLKMCYAGGDIDSTDDPFPAQLRQFSRLRCCFPFFHRPCCAMRLVSRHFRESFSTQNRPDGRILPINSIHTYDPINKRKYHEDSRKHLPFPPICQQRCSGKPENPHCGCNFSDHKKP